MNCYYLPQPPRAWSRQQNPITFVNPNDNYETSYIPVTGEILPNGLAAEQWAQWLKGNVLQYRGSTAASLTKSQKYSQLARMAGPNRRKVYATQNQTYTNPNVSNMPLAGKQVYQYPNNIVGAPNNPAGPFATDIPNPQYIGTTDVIVGSSLVCPCIRTNGNIFNPSSASNVPGASEQCWNPRIQSYIPRQHLYMATSGNKFPINYKLFVSAIHA